MNRRLFPVFLAMTRLYSTILALLLPILLLAQPLHASKKSEPELVDIIITTSQSHLLLFTGMKNGVTGEMLERIHSGIPVTFTFEIELDEVRSNWFDATLVETELTHTITYDSLKKEYQIVFSEKKGHAVTTRSLNEAKQLLCEINGYPLISRSRLKPDQTYALHIKAILSEKTLPLGMQYVLPFISYWNLETDRRTIEFRY